MIYCIFPIFVVDAENAQIQRECFESFNRFTPRENIKVIVVDNGSLFGIEDAKSFADIYVSLPEPVGFAKAVNIGWKMVEAFDDVEYVGVLNNDLTFLHDGWIDYLIEILKNDDKCCAAAPEDRGGVTGISGHIWSSCFFMRPDVREKIGYFDDKYLPYRYHDQDYWIRAKKLGYKFFRTGRSRVKHKESTTYKKMPQKQNESQEAQIMTERYGITMAEYYNG